MGLIITPQAEIDAYFASSAVSQSQLKSVLGGYLGFLSYRESDDEKAKYYEEKTSLLKGSGVDMLLTGEKGIYNQTYYLSTAETKPGETGMAVAHWVKDALMEAQVDIGRGASLGEYATTVMRAVQPGSALPEGWYKGNPGEKRINNLIQEADEYFKDICRAGNRVVLSAEEDNTIREVATHFENGRYAWLFDREILAERTDLDVYYQLPIYFEYRGIPCRALLDILIVYKDADGNVTALQPIDLKTMYAQVLMFPGQVRRFRYDIQAAWYTLALEEFVQNYDQSMFPVIRDFKFLVQSVQYPGDVAEYNLDSTYLKIGRYGRPKLEVNANSLADDFDNITMHEIHYNQIRGFESLFEEYIRYESGETIDVQYADNEGVFKLDINGIMDAD